MAEDEELAPRAPRPGQRSPQPDEYGSIIERFRGTEWESKPVVDPLRAIPATGPSPTSAMIGFGLVALVVVVGLAVMLVAPAPGPPAAPAAPAEGPRYSLRPKPTPSEEQRVLDAFWAAVGAKDASYHVDSAGSTSLDPEPFSTALDVTGDDFAGTYLASRGTATVIRKSATVYVRLNGRPWYVSDANRTLVRQVPFLGLKAPSELAYGDRVQAGDGVQHHLRSTPWFGPDFYHLLSYPDTDPVVCEEHSLEILVTDAGIPVHASFHCARTDHLVSGTVEFVGDAEFSYSAWGEPVEITAPTAP